MFSPKVMNNFKRFFFQKFSKRCISTSFIYSDRNVLQRLESRSLVRVAGQEVAPYLQGLITNDMKRLENGAGSMYSMFLNTRGRVVYDSIIYRTPDPKTFLVECDSSVIRNFLRHLNMFKVKRKIDIVVHTDKVWALFEYSPINPNDDTVIKFSSNVEPTAEFEMKENLRLYTDPRSNLLGTRILCHSSVSGKFIIDKLNIKNAELPSEDVYRMHRYHLGVGEGVGDLPPGLCYPLEANADFLHGVSFNKGCYIGQELTARTYHTGVVRKRLMPLLFEKSLSSEVPYETSVFRPTDSKTSIGKVRGVADKVGLGLLRVQQALELPSFDISGHNAKTYRPQWWPIEVKKN